VQNFICWKISDYSFDFHACDGSVKIFYFFLLQFWSYTFLRVCPFLPSYPFYWHIVPESSLLWSFVGEGNGTPLQYSCLENPMDGGAWRAAVHGVAKSRTRLSSFTFTFHFHALKKEMATHSSVLAWRIPGTGEPGGLPSMGSHRVGHDWSNLAAAAAAWSFLFLCCLLWFLHFHFWFCWFDSSPFFFFFFFWWVWLCFVYFIYLLKEPAFNFIDFCYGLLCFLFTYFSPNFYDFIPFTNPGVLYLFLF